MNQSLQTPTPTAPTAIPFNLKASVLGLSYRAFVAASALAALGGAQTLDVNELNTALEESLTTGRDAGKQLACTGTMVFFDSTFMKFVFGGMILVALSMALYAWYAQTRNGTSVSRVFIIIIVLMVFIAIAGVLTTSFMDCV